MIASIVATLVLAALAMTPGLLLVRGDGARPGVASAAMAASLTVTMLLTALVGIAIYHGFGARLPATGMFASALALCIVARLWTRERGKMALAVEWQGLVLGGAFLAYGYLVQALAIRELADGTLLVHGWYNADWFKHLGHVSAIANYGVPAVDNFQAAQPLYYYWLSYILPAAGVEIGGNGWSALSAANAILVMLFSSVFYGVLRRSGLRAGFALVVGLLALIISAPTAPFYQLFFGIGLENILAYPLAPRGPALLTLSQYIPQHLLALTALLGWYLLKDERQLGWLALAALSCAMALSVLLGAMALVTYGLYRLFTKKLAAVPELVAMVVLSGLFVVLFQVVQLGDVNSAIESPLLTNERSSLSTTERVVQSLLMTIGDAGVPLLVTVVAFRLWKPGEVAPRQAKHFAMALVATAILAVAFAEVALTERLALEMRIRAVNLPGIANAIVCGLLFQSLWTKSFQARAVAAFAVFALLGLALPSAVFRTIWHGRMGDAYTVNIPLDDRRVLDTLRNATDRRAIVLQFPEPPVLAPGGGADAWAAILGQRAVTASLRATNYPEALPRIESAKRFFAAEIEPIAQDIDLVYLSRALHPDTFDILVARMQSDERFVSLVCYEDACLFERRESRTP
ncbi:MAG: hypothetical protein WA918_05895 [Erythrobacter sp.]